MLWQHGLQLHSTNHSGNSWRGAGLQVVSRTSKLTYMWKGMAHLPALLQRLVKEEDQGDFLALANVLWLLLFCGLLGILVGAAT